MGGALVSFALFLGSTGPLQAQGEEAQEAAEALQPAAVESFEVGVEVAVDALAGATGGFGFSSSGGESTTALVPGGFRTRVQSAGDGFEYPWGVWVSYSHSRFEDEFVASAFDADSNAVFLGADFSPWDNYYFGVAVGYSTIDIDLTFNGGQSDVKTFSILPYLAIDLSDALQTDLDLSMGWSVIPVRTSICSVLRAVAAELPATPARIHSSGPVTSTLGRHLISSMSTAARVCSLRLTKLMDLLTAPVSSSAIFVPSSGG